MDNEENGRYGRDGRYGGGDMGMFIRAPEAARRLGISYSQVRSLMFHCKLAYIRLGGLFLLREAEVEAFKNGDVFFNVENPFDLYKFIDCLIEQVTHLRQKAWSEDAIADRLGVHKGFVHGFLKNSGMDGFYRVGKNGNYKSFKAPVAAIDQRQLGEEYLSGKTGMELGKKYHVGHRTILQILKANHIKIRSRGGRNHVLRVSTV